MWTRSIAGRGRLLDAALLKSGGRVRTKPPAPAFQRPGPARSSAHLAYVRGLCGRGHAAARRGHRGDVRLHPHARTAQSQSSVALRAPHRIVPARKGVSSFHVFIVEGSSSLRSKRCSGPIPLPTELYREIAWRGILSAVCVGEKVRANASDKPSHPSRLTPTVPRIPHRAWLTIPGTS